MRVVFKALASSVGDLGTQSGALKKRVVLHRNPELRGKQLREHACHGIFFAYDYRRETTAKIRETMTSRLEAYRVSAYNTAKQSENKMHDDTVAKRFGFSGGLVPGVDVMAYMMHLPVAKWGRAFLERGLIEARFVKPVYDGEIADVTARRAMACFRSRSRAAASSARPAVRRCRLPRHRFRFRISGNRGGQRAQAGECGVL
jgi:hypothetical protein